MAQGEQRNGDPLVAAMQLFGLCQAGSFHGVFFGMQESPASGPPSDKSTRNERSPRRGKEFKMTMPIFQCDFSFEAPLGTQLAEEFHDLARALASAPSLVWTYWKENEEEQRDGGPYLL